MSIHPHAPRDAVLPDSIAPVKNLSKKKIFCKELKQEKIFWLNANRSGIGVSVVCMPIHPHAPRDAVLPNSIAPQCSFHTRL
jgi:hypothetical protein